MVFDIIWILWLDYCRIISLRIYFLAGGIYFDYEIYTSISWQLAEKCIFQ